MKEHSGDRDVCPNCGEESTEFVQFATGEEETVETDPDEVGDGMLALYSCDNCRSGIEIVMEADRYRTIQHE